MRTGISERRQEDGAGGESPAPGGGTRVEVAEGITLYTLGYGARTLEAFLELLPRYAIEVLVDIRSQPYSRYRPGFSRRPLAEQLPRHGLAYAWMGDTLGGRPADPACYTEGRVDYARCREQPFFQEGIERLLCLAESRRCALMCSEGRPQECHRARLVGESLAARGVEVIHLDENGEPRPHAYVMSLVTGFQPDLFGAEYLPSLSRKRPRH